MPWRSGRWPSTRGCESSSDHDSLSASSSSNSRPLRYEFRDMFALIGMVVVLGAVIGGFLMEKGQLAVLLQPAELVIIGGAALGTLLIANPLPVVIKIIKGALGILTPRRYGKALSLE